MDGEKVGAWVTLPPVTESHYLHMLKTENTMRSPWLNSIFAWSINMHWCINQLRQRWNHWHLARDSSLVYLQVSLFKLLRLPLVGLDAKMIQEAVLYVHYLTQISWINRGATELWTMFYILEHFFKLCSFFWASFSNKQIQDTAVFLWLDFVDAKDKWLHIKYL